MKITRKITRAIKTACREALGGRRRTLIGQRHGDTGKPTKTSGFNLLPWREDDDRFLAETWPPDTLISRDIPDEEGWLALECYCYNLPVFGCGPGYDLDSMGHEEDKVCILINPEGRVICAITKDWGWDIADEFKKMLKHHNHPNYQY